MAVNIRGSAQGFAGGQIPGVSSQAQLGGRFDLSGFSFGTPAFWSLVLLVVLLLAIFVMTGASV